MDYMLDKIKLLENKDNIINTAEEIVKSIKNNNNLNDSERIMTMELAMAELNYDLYNFKKYKKDGNKWST